MLAENIMENERMPVDIKKNQQMLVDTKLLRQNT